MRIPYKIEYKDNLRKCTGCNEFKSFDSFNNCKQYHDGKSPRCKSCANLDRRKHRTTLKGKMATKRDNQRKRFKYCMPKCLSKQHQKEIDRIYEDCPAEYEVDHIHPRYGVNEKGEHISCGLHVPWNLQYLTPKENVKKANKIK